MGLSTYYCSLGSKDCTGILADGTALLEGHTQKMEEFVVYKCITGVTATKISRRLLK